MAFLTDEDASGLVDEYTWQLRSRLINFRFAAFTAFMLDVHNQLGISSPRATRATPSSSLTSLRT